MKNEALNRGVIPRVLSIVSLMAVMSFPPAFAAGADRYVAMTGSDTTDCTSSLAPCRTVAYAFNRVGDCDRIYIAAGTYTVNLNMNKSFSFHGAGMDATILDGGGSTSVLYNYNSYVLSIYDLTIRNGSSSTAGGGINNNGGALTLTRVKVTGNVADWGGGIFNYGQLTMTDCVVSANIANVKDDSRGGGLYLFGNGFTAHLFNVTISGNTAAGSGGGIYNGSSGSAMNVNLTNVTISGNTAKNDGAMTNTVSAPKLLNSTIADNHFSAGGSNGGVRNGGTLYIKNTIIADNDGTNCVNEIGSTMVSLGNNLDSGSSCEFTGTGDLQNTDPKLQTLADNGGLTQTHALFDGGGISLLRSPAIGSGANADCPATDQRGMIRPQGTNCDIGAYELCAKKPTYIDDTSSYFFSIAQAYDGVSNGQTIKMQMNEFSETLSFGLDRTVTLKGGYDCDYASNSGSYSSINGSLTISAGAVTVENLKIK